MCQPCLFIFIQIWTQTVKYHLMVGIDLGNIAVLQISDINRIDFIRAVCHRFKLQKLTIEVFNIFYNKKIIFNSDSKLMPQLDNWLIPHTHTRTQNIICLSFCRHTPADSMNSFMYTKHMSYPMACTTLIVDIDIP